MKGTDMATYFESGVGKAILHTDSANSVELGRLAATEALSHIKRFQPSLALAFISPELEIDKVTEGLIDVLGDCPLIGTSTAGEIADGYIRHGVVVAVLASPHLSARVGMGNGVGQDFQSAVNQALSNAGISQYFNYNHPQHQMLHMSAAGTPWISPVLLIVFSPGSTKSQFSLSHDIHSALRKSSANRIPIFGGSSGDYFQYDSNYQIVNNRVSSDAIALAFIETEILFGLGMSHGFFPTKKRALVTRASGHLVHEFDSQPAAKVYADMLGIPVARIRENLPAPPSPFNTFPFGSIDVYGNSLLHVPERIFEDGSIQFPHLISTDIVMTLMRANANEVVRAGVSAYEKAIRHGGIKKPASILMISCALRLIGEGNQEEIKLLREKVDLPICGFYTYGEKGMLDDGLPVYNNQSVSTLVFSDELNPVASLIHKGKKVYQEFTSQLDSKVAQIKSISRINQIIQDGSDVGRLLTALTAEFSTLFPWALGAFYLSADDSATYALASAQDFDQFPDKIPVNAERSDFLFINLDSHGKRFGVMALKHKVGAPAPQEEDTVLAETIGKLSASGLHRIELDGRLDVKLQQLEILNQLGHELSKSISTSSQSQNIVKHIRRILNLSFASLWLVDRTHQLLVKEAIDGNENFDVGEVEKQNDEHLAKWQTDHQKPLYFTSETGNPKSIKLVAPFPFSFVSLPIIVKGEVRGILNLYSKQQYKWSMQNERIFENMEFLQSIAIQIAIFIENRSLHKHATFYREIHHRVKNNLQNIASLLRMQLRRLDRVPAEQALTDSIARIMSIALVHDTLSQGEIGVVDLGRLVGSISKFSESEATQRPIITLDVSGPPIMIPSREATTLALVINELVQNAVQHGFKEKNKGRLLIRVEQKNGDVSVIVLDDGPGLPDYFDPMLDGNLGLTIVRTLVKDELKGQFEINCSSGTCARITFPSPQSYYPIER
jgi:two-component sensor histidine kinase